MNEYVCLGGEREGGEAGERGIEGGEGEGEAGERGMEGGGGRGRQGSVRGEKG